MKRNRFILNQNNRLLIKPAGAERLLATDGKFALEHNNSLVYLLNEPTAWRQEYGLPNKIKFKGSWRLNLNYDLELRLDKTERQLEGNSLCLRGKIIYAGAESLVFQIKSRDKRGVNRFSLLKFSGTWQADEFNRIIFQVKKKAKPDTLIFKEAWQINKNQQIIYEYERTKLKTKRKIRNSLTFTGFWQITSATRLRYILSGSSHSRFDFRVYIQTPNVYPKRGTIKFRVGVGLRQNLRPARIKIITLYGTWRFSRKLGLCFEMDYGQGKVRRLTFKAEFNLSRKNRVIFDLTDKSGKRLGISVIFRHSFLNKRDADWFLRLKRDFQEGKIETGVRVGF